MYWFPVAYSTIFQVVHDVCQAIIEEYAEEVQACATTAKEWQEIAKQCGSKWNFHHTVGALDEKHIAIKCPKNGGSLYFSYKEFHSIVLMALVDANYKLIWIDIGANGSASDAAISSHSEMKEVIQNGTIGFPAEDLIPHDDRRTPYFIIGDDAFPLRTWLMNHSQDGNWPDAERIFNYRLSGVRRAVENAFGILSKM